jgi:hypothetical protein
VRKYLAVLLGVLLILSFAVTAFAEDKTDITISGKIDTKGWYLNNVDWITGPTGSYGGLPTDAGSKAFYQSTLNLMVDAKVADNLRGFVEIQSGSSNRSGSYYWGSNDYDGKANSSLWIKQLWIQYTGAGLGLPAGIKIGHMPISVGEKQFLNNEKYGDDAILVWIDPTKELHVAAGTVKINEGDIYDHSDDLNGYLLMATYMWDKNNTVGINWIWSHSDGNCPSIDSHVNVDSLNHNNLGLHANGKLAGLSYAAEVDWQFGKAKGLEGDPDLKAKGYAVFAKVGYQLDPVNLRASFAMGSGDDKEDGDCKEFQTLQGPDMGFTTRLVHYTQIYERTVKSAAASAILTTQAGGNLNNTGIANTTYYNLGVDVTPMKELSLSLDGFILKATKTGLWEDQTGLDNISKNLGWEIDTKLTYKIAKNLNYYIEAGYFKPGSFYEDTELVEKKKAVTQAMHGISLSF